MARSSQNETCHIGTFGSAGADAVLKASELSASCLTHYLFALAEAVARAQPRLHIFGHIHEARGREGTGHNVASVDERYEPYAQPITVIDL
jgi:hypothetical protein